MFRRQPNEAIRRILAFLGHICKWHPEQLTLAEYSAFVARDVLAHIELAATAKVKEAPKKDNRDASQLAESDIDSDARDARAKQREELEIVDIGGGTMADVEDGEDDVDITECSAYP